MSDSAFTHYLRDIKKHELLSREEEHALAVRYKKTGDPRIAHRLVAANLRLVVKIAHQFRISGSVQDLIQEGNLGLFHAVKKFDPTRGIKLGSYASWWIRAYIMKYTLLNKRLVRFGTTQAQRKIFFAIKKETERLRRAGVEVDSAKLAQALEVAEEEIIEMELRMRRGTELSLDAPAYAETDGPEHASLIDTLADSGVRPDVQIADAEFTDVLREKLYAFGMRLRHPREREIFYERLLVDDPPTLAAFAKRYGVTRERARQIEVRVKDKLRKYLLLRVEKGTLRVAIGRAA